MFRGLKTYRRAFFELLSLGSPAIHSIETLDQLGIWERYMPEWGHVRNQPQFNPYHRWSVDRHLLETVANAAAHARDVRRPDLLLLGALLHDIGKGTGVDHSEAGAAVSAGVLRADGLVPRRPTSAREAGPLPPVAARHRHPARPRRPRHLEDSRRTPWAMRPRSSCCGCWPRPTERPPGARRGPPGKSGS